MEQMCREKLIFLDESGVNTNLVRRYGRAVGKQRVVDSAPFSTPKTTTVLSAMRLDGQFACRLYEGGTTKDRFLEYLREDLIPSLRRVILSSWTISVPTIQKGWRSSCVL